jgi:lipoate-protein ligase A
LFGTDVEFLIDTARSPQENMQLDHERAIACCAGTARPLLRLYSWNPWGVSLGAHQREYDVDIAACRREGFEVVRRPTGGRAVLHANEVTYCAVLPLVLPQAPSRTIHDIYRDIHILILSALHALGATDTFFEKTQPDWRAHYRSHQHSMVCFSSSARYEIVWHDARTATSKKVVGSAQKLYTPNARIRSCSASSDNNAHHGNAVVLQHGSILLGSGHERLAEVARVVDEHEREHIRQALQTKSATLEEVCGRTVSFDECAEAIQNVFFASFELQCS